MIVKIAAPCFNKLVVFLQVPGKIKLRKLRISMRSGYTVRISVGIVKNGLKQLTTTNARHYFRYCFYFEALLFQYWFYYP